MLLRCSSRSALTTAERLSRCDPGDCRRGVDRRAVCRVQSHQRSFDGRSSRLQLPNELVAHLRVVPSIEHASTKRSGLRLELARLPAKLVLGLLERPQRADLRRKGVRRLQVVIPKRALPVARESPLEGSPMLATQELVRAACVARRGDERPSETAQLVRERLARRHPRGGVDAQPETLDPIGEPRPPGNVDEVPPVERSGLRGCAPDGMGGCAFRGRGRDGLLRCRSEFVLASGEGRRLLRLVLQRLRRRQHGWDSLDHQLQERL
jgi:hypothetical protein